MRSYVLSIVAAAIVCAVAQGLLAKSTLTGRIVHLLCGILMAVTLITPLGKISFQGVTDYWDDLSYDAQEYVNEGTSVAENQMRDIIKSQSEAYILDKANRMGLQITLEVELDEQNGNVPCGVVISGAVSPYAREQLCAYMEDTLGIAKEKQIWK